MRKVASAVLYLTLAAGFAANALMAAETADQDALAKALATAKAKVSLATAVAKAVAGNPGFHAVSVFPALKDGDPAAEVSLHKGGEWKTVVEKLD